MGDNMSLRLNPQYEKMLPMMSLEEFEQLKESIRTEGQHYPIIVSESLEVLDGHHRFRACLELDVEPDFEVKHFEDKLLEKKFVIEANLRRRHLNKFQLVELAVPLLEIEKELSKKQKPPNEHGSSLNSLSNSSSGVVSAGKTTVSVAKKVGLSARTLERGKKIIEKASEDDKQKLREGKTSISKIYREITPPKTTQNIPFKSETLPFAPQLRNREVLAMIFKGMIEQDVFCPECGNKIFQCSQCHKSLNELVKSETQTKKTVKIPQGQPQRLMSDKSIITDESLDCEEDFNVDSF